VSGADRAIRSPADLDALVFNDRGLIPVVAQDVDTGVVLMVAWADRTALEHTVETGFMHYHSRSRDALWKKGEASGSVQEVVSLHGDCDGDTVLARVLQTGAACHTGTATCFGEGGRGGSGAEAEGAGRDVLAELQATLESRLRDRPEGSYTSKLLSDENLRVKKLGEESAELIAALTRGDPGVTEEAADLVYHLMVALLAAGRSWDEVLDALRRRQDK
jgi:phosphoribosyl-AMP cyclohydrolase / phosphoribosyl-ATP pyrophosphohydrolase